MDTEMQEAVNELSDALCAVNFSVPDAFEWLACASQENPSMCYSVSMHLRDIIAEDGFDQAEPFGRAMADAYYRAFADDTRSMMYLHEGEGPMSKDVCISFFRSLAASFRDSASSAAEAPLFGTH